MNLRIKDQVGASSDAAWPSGVGDEPDPEADSRGMAGADCAFLATLPTDPDALRDRLYRDTEGRGNSVDGEAFVCVTDLLRDGTLPADVTRRMYALLRTIPGVDVLPDPSTVDGKTGTVLAYNHGTVLGDQQLLTDPNTGALIAENGNQPWGASNAPWSTPCPPL